MGFMKNFATKYVIAIVIVVILMIVFRESDVVIPLNNVLGVLGLLAWVEAMSEILKK